MSGLLAAIAGSLHPVTSGPKAPVQIILTSGTSWTVPADWNSADNKVECIGAGFRGGSTGGGGGAYAKKSNVSFAAGSSIGYQIGAASIDTPTAQTWFGSTSTVMAVGSLSDRGGAASLCVGDIAYSGGDGFGGTSGGGGGAAGPNGNGNSASGTSGASGDNGFGGAGGSPRSTGSTPGVPGGNGTEWGGAGSGGGGGGAQQAHAGDGGLYGGGGGRYSADPGSQGLGAPGVIVITYTPA